MSVCVGGGGGGGVGDTKYLRSFASFTENVNQAECYIDSIIKMHFSPSYLHYQIMINFLIMHNTGSDLCDF